MIGQWTAVGLYTILNVANSYLFLVGIEKSLGKTHIIPDWTSDYHTYIMLTLFIMDALQIIGFFLCICAIYSYFKKHADYRPNEWIMVLNGIAGMVSTSTKLIGLVNLF